MYVNIFIYYVCVSSMYHLKKSKDSRCVHLCLVTGCLEGWKLDAGHQALGLVFSQVGWGKYGGKMGKRHEIPWVSWCFLRIIGIVGQKPETMIAGTSHIWHKNRDGLWAQQISKPVMIYLQGGETVQDPSKFQFTIQVLQGPFSCSRWIATAVGTFNPYWIERWYSMDKYLG